ncbi:MAG: hypothetical protein SNJ70_09070 [Armatimonadota bacterium]
MNMQKQSKRSHIKYSLSSNAGAAYLISITALMMGMILALALLRTSNEYFFSEYKNIEKQGAKNLAEAGINYGFWCVHYNLKHPPYSQTVNTQTGSFQITIQDDGNRDPSTMLITSTGQYKGESVTLKRVVLGPLPYYYAWCENRSVQDGDRIIINGIIGGMRANGSINLTNNQTNVSTGGWATGSKFGAGVVNPLYTNYAPIRFPQIDLPYYTFLSPPHNGFLDLSDKLNATNYPSKKALICVNGDVKIAGQYDGIYTIVSNGTVDIRCPVRPQNQNSYLAVLSTDSIRIWASPGPPYDNNNDIAEGIFYAKNSTNTGTIYIYRYVGTGKSTIKGSIAADDIVTMRWEYGEPNYNPIILELWRDERINLSIIRDLRLPGIQ